MSFQEILNNKPQTWLNCRVNNLQIDGAILGPSGATGANISNLNGHVILGNPSGASGPAQEISLSPNTLLGYSSSIRAQSLLAPLGITGNSVAILSEGFNASKFTGGVVNNNDHVVFNGVTGPGEWYTSGLYDSTTGAFVTGASDSVWNVSYNIVSGATGQTGRFQLKDAINGDVYATSMLLNPLILENVAVSRNISLPAGKTISVECTGGNYNVGANSYFSAQKLGKKV